VGKERRRGVAAGPSENPAKKKRKSPLFHAINDREKKRRGKKEVPPRFLPR